MKIRTRQRLAMLLLLALPACAGRSASASYAQSATSVRSESYGGESDSDVYRPAMMNQESIVESAPRGQLEEAGRTSAPGIELSASQRMAAVAPQATRPDAETTATDAVDTSGELLIYNAGVVMAVYEVRDTQARLIARVREAHGFVSQQTDHQLVLRIPAAHFRSFMDALGEEGRVLDRNIAAQDVGEEFRDIEIRIRNLEVTRQRIEALLAQAANVADALAVQRELERITSELEAMRGRQRYLADRIAFSTITINFQPLPREAIAEDETFLLPFRWLRLLGLHNLLEMN